MIVADRWSMGAGRVCMKEDDLRYQKVSTERRRSCGEAGSAKPRGKKVRQFVKSATKTRRGLLKHQ